MLGNVAVHHDTEKTPLSMTGNCCPGCGVKRAAVGNSDRWKGDARGPQESGDGKCKKAGVRGKPEYSINAGFFKKGARRGEQHVGLNTIGLKLNDQGCVGEHRKNEGKVQLKR